MSGDDHQTEARPDGRRNSLVAHYDRVSGRRIAHPAQEAASAGPATEMSKPVKIGAYVPGAATERAISIVKCNDLLHSKIYVPGCLEVRAWQARDRFTCEYLNDVG